jgi:Spy/CpxP family protein refolding chaperone
MNMRLIIVIGLIAFSAVTANTQSSQPYSGMQTRDKALSEEQIADLKAGRGMGLALAAELNGYPGPKHLLELADDIGLTDQQREKIRQLFGAMQLEAIPIGQALITEEAKLDRGFADRSITEATLKAQVATISEIQGQLRYTHLKYHLATVELLTPEQMQKYATLRGYLEASPERNPHSSPMREHQH